MRLWMAWTEAEFLETGRDEVVQDGP